MRIAYDWLLSQLSQWGRGWVETQVAGKLGIWGVVNFEHHLQVFKLEIRSPIVG